MSRPFLPPAFLIACAVVEAKGMQLIICPTPSLLLPPPLYPLSFLLLLNCSPQLFSFSPPPHTRPPPFRGKGDYYRLGTDSNAHMREPQLVESLSKKVAQIAVGSLHCLALTDDGEVGQQYPYLTSYFTPRCRVREWFTIGPKPICL